MSVSARAASDRNLLFGILALQMDFISRDALIKAMQAWVLEKSKPLGQLLIEQGAMAIEHRALLEPLVQKHVEMHGNDPQKSLAAISSAGSAKQELAQIADADLQAGLATVSVARPAEEDPWATRPPSIGTPTSSGLRFRVLRPHAKGGLGQVSVALDEELHREVAFKEIQDRHADYPESRARFLLEAEITGGLEHPGIVPVYGLGAYPDGRPFYAMRFIKGDSLQDAIARFHKTDGAGSPSQDQTLALRQLLGRFIDVCDAIAYAHSRGVLHRDLKPGNVMLGPYGETLVVDWGLAKPIGARGESNGKEKVADEVLRPVLSDSATPTQAGTAIGTPAYMPPEQAAGRLDALGPTSDVYSLGATLYCLLTGKAPFERGDVGEILQKVQAGTFPPPREIRRDVPAALEAVCLKAMALKPEDRYASPRALAADVERWLADEPVSAYREPWSARSRRWMRRRRTLVSTTVGVLIIALLSATVGLVVVSDAQRKEATARKTAEEKGEEALKQKDEAQKQKENAERAAQTATEVATMLAKLFESSDPIGVLSGTPSSVRSPAERQAVKEMLDDAYNDARGQFLHQPALRALLLDSIGNAYRSLGLYDQAEAPLREALTLRRERAEEDPLKVAESLHHLAWWHHEKGNYDAAKQLYREALAIRVKAYQTEEHLQVAASKFGLAWLLTEAGESAEPEKLLREVIATRRRLLGGDRREVGIAQVGLAAFLIDRQRIVEALPLIVSAAKVLLTQGIQGELGKLGEAVVQFQLGIGLRDAGSFALAEPALGRALKLSRQALGEQHIYVALVLHELGDAQEKRGDLSAAEITFTECLQIASKQVGLTHPKSVYPIASLARVRAKQGRVSEGEQLFARLREEIEKRLGKENVRVAAALSFYAHFLGEWRDLRRSAQVYQEADDLFRKIKETRNRYFAMNLSNEAVVCWRLGQYRQAEKLAREALPLLEEHSGKDSLIVIDLLDTLALALIDQKKFSEAEPICVSNLKLSQRHPSLRWNALDTLGRLHRGRGDLKQAEHYYREALVLARKQWASRPADLGYSLNNLADVLAEGGQYSQAAPLFAEAAATWEKENKKAERKIVGALCDLALARLAAGDAEGYRRQCRELLSRIGASKDEWMAERVGRTLYMRSDSLPQWNAFVALTEPLATKSPPRLDALLVRAGVLYRTGRYAEAGKLLKQQPVAGEKSQLLLAEIMTLLCEYRLKPNDAVLHTLDKAIARFLQQTPTWQVKLLVKTLRRDAESGSDASQKHR